MKWRSTMFFGKRDTLTLEQACYLDTIAEKQLTIVNAKSGTGKTTLAVGAARLLRKPLVYLFNPVEEHRMGFRPGTQADKEADYLQPLKDALLEINESPAQVIFDPEIQVKNAAKDIWVYPMSHIFARGINIQGKTVIVEEAQNWPLHDLKKVLTRIHDDCKVIVIGHTGQIDLKNPKESGFPRLIEYFADKPYAGICELTKNFRGQLSSDADNL